MPGNRLRLLLSGGASGVRGSPRYSWVGLKAESLHRAWNVQTYVCV